MKKFITVLALALLVCTVGQTQEVKRLRTYAEVDMLTSPESGANKLREMVRVSYLIPGIEKNVWAWNQSFVIYPRGTAQMNVYDMWVCDTMIGLDITKWFAVVGEQTWQGTMRGKSKDEFVGIKLHWRL